MDLNTPELIWFLIGLVLIILEFAIPGVITVFFGIGAWVVSLLCLLFNVPLNLQIIIFIIISILSLILLRKSVKRLLENRAENAVDELHEFIDQRATVLVAISPEKAGRVEFRGSSWNAESDEKISEGSTVKIIDKKNITLIVKSL
jgi:membrane protein implicated in regulation of membrane protease activity